MIPPVVKTIEVAWSPEEAFRRFTSGIASWWPLHTHSVGEGHTVSVVFEGRVGGTIHEVTRDGSRHVWGTVLEWDPPVRTRFTWHPGMAPETAGDIVLQFEPSGGGTRLVLTHGGWERFGAKAARASRAYRLGWEYVLRIYAGRAGLLVYSLDAIRGLARLWRRLFPVKLPRPTAG